MIAVYNLCVLLIKRGRTTGLLDKLDAYLAADRITVKEYQVLTEMIKNNE